MKRLIFVGGNLYSVNMDLITPKFFEPMPMAIPSPEPGFRVYMNPLPQIRIPSAIMTMDTYYETPAYKLAFLFPLGRRGFTRTICT